MILTMRGLDLIAVLLLFQSWRRLGSRIDNSMVAGATHHFSGFGNDESDSDGDDIDSDDDEFDLEMSHWRDARRQGQHHVNAIRHKIFPQMAMIDRATTRLEKVRIRNESEKDSGGGSRRQLIRHSSRFLDKLLLSRRGGNNMSSIAAAERYFSYGRQNLTISQLIENLRGMRARRRRSSMANLKTSESKKSLGSPLARPPKKVAEIDGQIVLGGLMMVHERGDVLTCGPIMPQGGIQALEMMLYTVDYINKNKFLPGIELGVHILDDCDKDTYGLEQAVDFIKGSISNIDDVELGGKCLNGSVSSLKNKVIAGVVGAASSVTSIQVANLLRLFRIPQVSYFSTSPELSVKPRFDFFSRTIPSDKNQVQVMVDIIEKFHWKYVSIIYEESNYGSKTGENKLSVVKRDQFVTEEDKLKTNSNLIQKVVSIYWKKKPYNAEILKCGDKDEMKLELLSIEKQRRDGHLANETAKKIEQKDKNQGQQQIVQNVLAELLVVEDNDENNQDRIKELEQELSMQKNQALKYKNKYRTLKRKFDQLNSVNNGELGQIGEEVFLPKSQLDTILAVSDSASKLARNLMRALFEDQEMVGHSLFGLPCNANKQSPTRSSIDSKRRDAIILYAYNTFGGDMNNIRCQRNPLLVLLHQTMGDYLRYITRKGVIIYGSDQEVKALMRAVRRRNATGSFTWIGSDGWSSRTLVSDGNEPEVEGTLSVQPRANPVDGFDEYFLGLNVKNNVRNPWFVEFWENHFECIFPNSTRGRYNQNFTRNCTGDEKLKREETQFEAQLQFVSDAVLAFAHAFRDMHNVMCGGQDKPGLCDQMKPIDGTILLKYLKNVSFIGLSGDDFHFDISGDGPARYNIIHFRRVGESYGWVRVGEYNQGNLTLRMSEIRFSDGSSTAPVSVCSDACGFGEAKRIVVGIPCCWSCSKCLNDQIRHEINESSCFTCALGTLPNSNHVKCIPIPEVYLQPTSGWGIGAMTFAGVGILLTLFVFSVFIVHNDTPVVRASGRELSYVLLSGLFLCYALTFLFVVFRPNDIICGIQQFGTGFCFTIVYAALLTKTNRIARIFQAGRRSARRPSFISPRSQLVICSMLLFIQVIINIVWMLLQPPQAMHHYPSREDNLLVCNTYINASYTIAFAYPIGLIVVCTIYAVLTRKIPEAFNESKYIGFTMYTTCIIWLAFVPIYFSTANQVALRITSMTVAISLSATVMVACLFTPKLYIILFHPERNVRQSLMPVNRFSAIGGAAAAGGGTTSISLTTGGPLKAIPMSTLQPNHIVENFSVAHSKVDCATQSDGLDFIVEEKVRQLLEHKNDEGRGKSTCATQTENNNISSTEQINGMSDGRNVPNRLVTFVTPIHEKNISLIERPPTEWHSTQC